MNQVIFDSEKTSGANINHPAVISKRQKIFDFTITGSCLIFFIYYFSILFSQLHETFFWADENFHSYISGIISETHQIPFYLPDEIYGKYILMYPPLLHIIGGLAISLAGVSALQYINFLLLLLFFPSFFILIQKYYDRQVALIACLLLSLSPVVAINSVRFMTEMLSMLMMFFSFFFAMLALQKNRFAFACFSGMFTGLFILSKQVGIVVLSYYVILLFWFLIKKNRNDAKIMFWIIAISVLMVLPYFLNAIIQDVNIFEIIPRFGNQAERYVERVKIFQRYDSGLKDFAYHFFNGNGFILSVSFLLPLYYFIRKKLKNPPQHYFFFLSFYLVIAMIAHHITNSRHTITLLPLIAFLFGYTLTKMFRDKIMQYIILSGLVITCVYSTYNMPNYREQFNAPKDFIEIAEIIKRDNSPGRTLCINPFDALMYTQKPVIWPTIHLANPPSEILEEKNIDRFYGLLKNYNIDYIIIWTKFLGGDTFIRNYPVNFYDNCRELISQQKMKITAKSIFQSFYLLKVI